MSLPKKSDKYGVIFHENFQPPHPSRDGSNRFAVDALLRSKGFRIYFRGRKGEPLWERGGALFRQTQAEDRVNQSELMDAEYMESLYWEGYPE